MKIKSVQGFLLARSFLYEYYISGNKMDDILAEMLNILTLINQKNARHQNVIKLVKNAWDRMCDITQDEDKAVQALPFCFRLILRNPSLSKYERLRILTQKANGQFLFRTEQDIKDAKEIVDIFYKESDEQKHRKNKSKTK